MSSTVASSALVQKLTAILLDPNNATLLSLVKGVRNGIVYGSKIRFPHALVMVMLFRSGTFREKLKSVFQATRTHGQNLASFVLVFKVLHMIFSSQKGGDPARFSEKPTRKTPDAFLAGAMAGYLVFGRDGDNPINQQIVLYIFGRTMMALLKLAGAKTGLAQALDGPGDKSGKGRGNWWGLFSAASWGGVMWLFRYYPEFLQGSLRSSMVYLYQDSERWTGWRNFLLYNV
ncbi:peroxisomal membrane protein 4 [Ascobolus immersus RN42]|uniref:Peroxisomal membrane protein 4 n=1 Tax=Ascobolus immersus RN42 TaxID=1160509 RepID=A0A3N4HVH9_ASCIM|nr:peroxisomal membrane protein 4 [Ascobolus immersus RN42]